MDIAVLTQFLAPFLPFLIQIDSKAVERVSNKSGEDASEKAKAVWAKLRPQVEAKLDAKVAVEQVAAKPKSKARQAVLQEELETLLKENPDLAEAIAQLIQEQAIDASSFNQASKSLSITAPEQAMQQMLDERLPQTKLRVEGDRNQVTEQVRDDAVAIGNVNQDVYVGVRSRWVGKPFQAPALPSYFVERPEHCQAVKALLLSQVPTTPGILVVSAIYGLGGIGKSTLAAAITYEQEVQAQFPDGILWATLGQQPDVLSFLSGWIQALGDYDYKPTTPGAASMHLRMLLYDKRALLVVDDVWKSEHIEPFQVGGCSCRVLVTTREAAVPRATHYDLNVMTKAQSLELVTNLSQGSLLTKLEQQQIEAFAAEVGYIPLALELAAVQIADGVSWAELREDLQAEVARLEALDQGGKASSEEKGKHLCLVASLNLSLRQLSPKQLQQFAWLGVLPEDVTITQAMAATLWEVSRRQAGAILRFLQSKALLLPSVTQLTLKPTYRIHDLIHDAAKRLLTASIAPTQTEDLPGLGLTLPAAHSILLERYWAKTQDRLWHTLPDDGYIHTYLSWHLEQAQRVEELHQLLQEETQTGRNGWYEACERLGQTASFVTAIARAWRLAEDMFEDCPPQAIAWQCRYALITASLNSLVKNIPAGLIVALVKEQLWKPAQGLAYAQQAPEWQRAEAIKGLAPHLPETLFPKALVATRTLQDEFQRASVLSTLVPYLPSVLPEALAAARAVEDESERVYVLSTLAPHLPEVLPEALAAASSIQNVSIRVRALSLLAPHLPSVLPEALAAARAVEDESERVYVLSTLAPHLEALLPEALAIARSIQNESERVYVLSTLAPHLPSVLPEALAIARSIQNESERVYVLSTLAPHLPSVLPEALAAARTIENEFSFARVFGVLALYLPSVLPQALAAARAIQVKPERARALSLLAPHFPSVLPEALAAARTIENEFSRVYILSTLAPHLPEVLPEALAAARAIGDESIRARSLSVLAPHFPEVLPEALAAARAIGDESIRALALSLLAPHFPSMLPEALAAARAVEGVSFRTYVLSILALHFSEVLPEALAAARAIGDESIRARSLSVLAPHSPEVLPEALAAARAIQSASVRAQALSLLLPQLDLASTNFSFWCEILHNLACRSRRDLLVNIPNLIPLIINLGNTQALALVAQAIQDVNKQWT